MKILFAGGGTLGPVTPLLAIIDELGERAPEVECVFVGTPDGPERRLVEEAGVRFVALSAPKLRRYFSLRTLWLPFALAAAAWRARNILERENPDVVVGAGGYTQVPLMIAARLRGTKIVIHQQDIVPTLSNRLVARFADAITVTFETSLKDFPFAKTTLIGNPVRAAFERGDRSRGLDYLGFSGERPVLLVIGGGTGSAFLNRATFESLPHLTGFADVAHLTGIAKGAAAPKLDHPERYRRFDFIGAELADVFAAADLAIARAGLGTLTELAAGAKPAILVPIPGSHQEKNAEVVVERGGARMFRESEFSPERLAGFVRELLRKPDEAAQLGRHLQAIFRPGAREALVERLLALAPEKR